MKIARLLTLVVCVACSLGAGTVMAQGNVARGKPVTLNGNFPTFDLFCGSPPPQAAASTITDGVFRPAGTCWQLGAVYWQLELSGPSSIDIDLLGTFVLDGATVQGDNNDAYQLQYRDSSGVYHDWWQVPIVSGSGLQTRTNRSLPPVTATGLRLFGVNDRSDWAFSISEIQVFSAANVTLPITAVSFPKEVIPVEAGRIEFWARLSGVSGAITVGGFQPHFFQHSDGVWTFHVGFNANDGVANGGLVGAVFGFHTGTGFFGSWTFEEVFGAGQVGEWHHYVVQWNQDGIPGVANGQQRIAIFVDGVLNSTRWHGSGASTFMPLAGGTLNLVTSGNPPPSAGEVTIDEFKIYDGDDNLILWNTLGSAQEIEQSAVGLPGSFNGGGGARFVPGIVGNAVRAAPVFAIGPPATCDDCNPPDALDQFRADGVSAIPVGGTTPETTVRFRGTVSGPDDEPVRLEIELRSLGAPFTGAATHQSALVASDTTATVVARRLANGSYHWQARTVNGDEVSSGWVAFGGNAPSAADFRVLATVSSPTGLGQFRPDGVSAIAVGGTIPETTVILRGVVSDPNAKQVKLQIEMRPIATAFTGVATHETALVASGTPVAINVAGLANGSYRWQARAVNDLETGGAWVAFGGNASGAADFTVANTAPTLAFTGAAGYMTDGVEPNTGRPTTSFTFRVTYTDADGHPPAAGSPQVHVLQNGRSVAGAPFAMTLVSGTPATGAIYTYSGTLAEGTYTHHIAATDTQGATATGAPTGSLLGPTVVPDAQALLSSPSPGSVLPGTAVLFTWIAGAGAAEYVLQVGTTLGGSDLYTRPVGLALSRTVDNLSGNSVPVYVRLRTRIGETWQHTDYTFTATAAPHPAKAALISPGPGTGLPGTSVAFTWSAATGATGYSLYVGTTRGGTDIYAQWQGLARSRTVDNLPGNGVPVYVRLRTRIGEAWQYSDYQFTATSDPSAPRAALISPTPGSVLSGTSVSFTWSAGSGAMEYSLYVGTTRGGAEVYSGSQGLALSRTVDNLPGGGVPVYVRLRTRFGEIWQYIDYEFTATDDPGTVKAALTSPIPRSALPGVSVPFTWSAGTGATEYSLWVGTTRGGTEVYARSEGLALSRTVDNLPGSNIPVYVRLRTRLGGIWQYTDYEFTATSAPNAPKAALTGALGNVLPGTSVAFTWSAGTGATEYALHVGTTRGGREIYGQSLGLALSRTVDNLPGGGVPVYVRLRTRLGGIWQHTDYTFTARNAPNAPAAALISPAPGSILPGTSVPFTWSAGTGATEYFLSVGTTRGGTELHAQSKGLALSSTVINLPRNSVPVYVRLRTRLGGIWQYTDYTVIAAP